MKNSEMLNATGTIADIVSAFYLELINNGIPAVIALELTKKYVEVIGGKK